MKLLNFYESLLKTAGFDVTSDGFVRIFKNGEYAPMTITKRSVVIPTREQLAVPDWSNRVVFNPLLENIMKGESEVLYRFRLLLSQRINIVVSEMLTHMLSIASDVDEQKKLKGASASFLSKVADADSKTIDGFMRLIEILDISRPADCFVNITLSRRGQTVDGQKYARSCQVNFPFYHAEDKELKEKDGKFYKAKLRVKDIAAIKGALEFIFPRIQAADSQHVYNFGSNSNVSPFLDCLLQSVRGLLTEINNAVEVLAPDEATKDQWSFRMDWFNAINNLETFLPEMRLLPNFDTYQDEVEEAPVVSKPAAKNPLNAPLTNFNSAPPVPTTAVQPAAPPVPTATAQKPATTAPINPFTGKPMGTGYAVADPAPATTTAPTNPFAQPAAPAPGLDAILMQQQQPAQQVVYNQFGQPMVVNQFGQPIAQPVVNSVFAQPVAFQGTPMAFGVPGAMPVQYVQPQAQVVGEFGYPIRR